MMMMMGMLFVWSMQPYILIISMIFITLYYSYLIYMMMMNYWFGYMLILIMMSGILIIFTYMVSLIPNESFEFMKLLYISMMIYMILGNMYLMDEIKGDMSLFTMKLWMSILGMYNMYLVNFLFMMMLLVAWVSNLSYGAVRNL